MNHEIMKWVEKTGGPAFPLPIQNQHGMTEGMSLRDYFAGNALMGLMASETETCHYADTEANTAAGHAASRSYEIADAMLKERNK